MLPRAARQRHDERAVLRDAQAVRLRVVHGDGGHGGAGLHVEDFLDALAAVLQFDGDAGLDLA